MLDKDLQRIEISQIIGSQLPNSFSEENSLFSQFLTQYYISQNQITELAENIDRYVNVENFDSTQFTAYSTTLEEDITYYDDVITVTTTKSWPNKYGLLKIDNEIITYTSKDATHFYGCVRGFSGIDSYQSQTQPGSLVFSSTTAEAHVSGTLVKNISSLIYVELWKNIKSQFLPGFQDKALNENVDKKLFLKQAKDFYETKGTLESYKILFKVLYGDPNVKLVTPSEYLLKPSVAQWSVSDNLIVEVIYGDIDKINGQPIIQDTPYAYGNVYLSSLINLGEQVYHEIQLSNDTKLGKFVACPVTRTTIGAGVEENTIFVDSTVGFPNVGELYINGEYVTYNGKNDNQFFNCVISASIDKFVNVYANSFAYSYEDGDKNKPVYMRITSILSNYSDLLEKSKYLKVGDEIGFKNLGEDVEINLELYNNRFNNWFQNNTYEIKVVDKPNGITQTSSPATINTKVPHGFKLGDSITLYDVDDYDNSFNPPVSGTVIQIYSPTSFALQFVSGTLNSNLDYKLYRNIHISPAGQYKYLADIQNTYVNPAKDSVYVTSTSLPSYSIPTNTGTLYFGIGSVETEIITTKNSFNVTVNHNLQTGDKVYYSYSGANVGINTGAYYVKKVSNTQIKLAYNRAKIYQDSYITFTPSGAVNAITNAVILYSLAQRNILDQKLIKRIPIDPKIKKSNFSIQQSPLPFSVGILLNGTEVLYPKSDDKVFYGKLTSIDVTAGGEEYDLINPPNVIIEDSVGVGASAFVHLEGSLSGALLLNSGYDYLTTPTIKITGGNGSGATAEAVMKSIFTTIDFAANSSGINTTSDQIGFSTYHNFKTGEEVIYRSYTNTGIGIGTDGAPAAGESDTKAYLIDLSKYYVIKVNDSTIKLTTTEENALAGINTINITQLSKGNNSFISTKTRNIVDRIEVTNPGSGYVNKKVIVEPQSYPPNQPQNIPLALVGINTQENFIYAKSHNFAEKELIYYNTTGSTIAGLNTSQAYYIIKLDNDKFRLASAGIGTTLSSVNYDQNKYVKVAGFGTGEHTFYTPPIQLEILGTPNSVDVSGNLASIGGTFENSQALAVPVFTSSVTNIFLKSGGTEYGTPEIINFNRKPNVLLSSGKDAVLQPIVINGGISEVYILNGGSGYTSVPDIVVTGDGAFASLKPIISEGKIINVEVIDSGKNYKKQNTILTVVSRGKNAFFDANVQVWHINYYKRYESIINDPTNPSNSIYIGALNKSNISAQLVSPIVPKQLRYLLEDNLDANLNETPSIEHSPIVGWAYDGNPIYGPYGSSNASTLTGIKALVSGYELIPLGERPSYPPGFFIEDYVYTANGDLDENNGRYCITPDFPNGTYAYFATTTNYPYVLNDYAYEVDDFNLNSTNTQDYNIIESENLTRNTSPYKINREYSVYNGIDLRYGDDAKVLVRGVQKSGVDFVNVIKQGSSYKINDRLEFDNRGTNGRGLDAKVTSLVGIAISNITNVTTTYSNIEFIQQEKNVIGIFTSPHALLDLQTITISGINTASYKFIEGKYKAGVSTFYSKVRTAIGTTAATGIATEVVLTESPYTKNIVPGDIIGIGVEQLLVLGSNRLNTGYKVLRGFNSSVSVAHTATSEVTLKGKVFSVPISLNLIGVTTDSANTKLNRSTFFNPQLDVGYGSTTTSIQIGFGITATPIGVQTGQGSYTKIEFYSNPFKIGDLIETQNILNLNISPGFVAQSFPDSILVNYDSTAVVNVGVATTSVIKQIKKLNIPPGSLYIPNHGFINGEQVKYTAVNGIGLTCSPDIALTSEFTLQSGSNVYVIVDTQDFIGVSTTLAGITSALGRLYFPYSSQANGLAHELKTTYQNPIGQISLNEAVITTFDEHNLKHNDSIIIDLLPNQTENITVKFDNTSARILINPVGFGSTQVSTTNNTITIYDNTFKTGSKVVYNSANPVAPLINGEEYFVVKVDKDKIQLVEYLYDAKNPYYSGIVFTSVGGASHTLSPINPPIKGLLGNTLSFNIGDASLNSLVLDFYLDDSFTNKINLKNITRTGTPGDGSATTKVNLKLDTNVPDVFYYKLRPVGLSTITSNAYAYNVDTDVDAYSQIVVEVSKYNGIYNITSVGSTTINVDLLTKPELSQYTNSGVTTFRYYTDSLTATGGIREVSIGFTGTGYLALPEISSLTSVGGTEAELKLLSDNIGKIKNLNIINSGYNFPTDPSLKPKADIPFVLKLRNNYQLKDVVILDSGKNYLVEPKLICIEHPEIEFDSKLEGGSIQNAKVTINKTGLSLVPPTIIPINNSNGLTVKSAVSDGLVNTLSINSDNGSFIDFPFEVGDKVFVEGIELTEALSGAGGYNSSDYNYAYFDVTSIDTTPGAETVTYSIVGLGSTGGYYDSTNSVGRVIKYDDLAKFTATLEKTDFIENETIFSNGSLFKVYKDGWNSQKDLLKIVGNSFNIGIGNSLVGSKTNSKAVVDEIDYSDAHFNCAGERVKENGWRTRTGFVNDTDQRIQDSNYYQSFSYAINSLIQKNTWINDVEALAHPSGMAVFGDVVVNSKPSLGIGRSFNLMPSTIDTSDTLINILSESSFNTKQYFDKSFEVTTNKGISKDVGLLSKKLFDYSICKTNRVQIVDDISDEFNGTSLLELDNINADGANLLLLNREFIQSEVVGFITNTYPGILSNLDFDSEVCERDVGYIVDAVAYDLKYGGNEKSVAAGLSYWTGVGGTSFVDGESQETIGGFRYIINLSQYVINNVAISTSYQSTPFTISQSYNYTVSVDTDCSPSYNANCCANTLAAINSYVGIVTSIIGIGTTAAPDVTVSNVSKGGTIVGLTSFRLNRNNKRLLSVSFTAQTACGVGQSIINLPNHRFNTGEEIIYDPGAGGTPIAIESTNRVIGGATTNFMPSRVFIYKVDDNRIKVVGLKTDAVPEGNYFKFRDIGSGFGVGAGITHTFYPPYDSANTRCLITIDNIIQKPIARENLYYSLTSSVGLGATIVSLTGITSITPANILRVDDELMKINAVGFGSTNVLSVQRGYMGTISTSHTIGAGVTVLTGDYNVNNGVIYFTTAPYGEVGPVGVSTRSNFSGRVFYRLSYDTNYVFDNIGNSFDGSSSEYELKSYGKDVTGIITDIGNNILGPNYGIITINNILQKPVIDYNITERAAIGIGGSISFTGTSYLDLPKGGIINNVLVGFGSGYQPLVAAYAIPVVSGSGTIQSLVLTSSGSGYRSNVEVNLNSQVGSGASIIALVGTGTSVGIITGFSIISGGTGYASTLPPNVYVGIPTAYSNLPLLGGSGTGAKVNIIVGSGGSVTQFEFANRGLGYKVNDILTISNIPTQVGIATSAFTLTVVDRINDVFSGWHFGNLTLLDDISSQFNGRSKTFLLTKTDLITERYTINALPGSGIDPTNNLIIILNGVVQQPNQAYTLVSGDRITFTEAPPTDSECLIFFYKGSVSDVADVNVSPEVKVGDSLRLLRQTPYVEQLQRVVTNFNTISEVKTTNYIDVGISSDPNFFRTLTLDKQKSDLVIDNVYISKARSILEGKFIPTSRIIKNVKTTDTEIYVENAFPHFSQLDDLLENRNSVILFNEKDTETAKITATVSTAGTVTNYIITNPGFGYASSPEVTVSTVVDLIPQYGKTWVNDDIEVGVATFRNFDFGNGRYVACGDAGKLSTSVNFVNWTSQSLGITNDLKSVAYGNNNWVLVGSGTTILTSTTGLSWTYNTIFLSRVFVGGIIPFDFPPATFSGDINGVDYGFNKFVAVGAGGTALVSEAPTGITTSWVVRTAGTNTLNSVAFGLDNFVAVGDNGAIVRTSDGYVWTNQTSGTSNKLRSVKYLNNCHIAVGDNGTILKSTDGGGTWSNVSEPEFSAYALHDVTYKNSVYIITGSSQLTLVSINGSDWIRTTNSGMDIYRLGTELFNVIGVGQSSQYAVTESEVVKATVTSNISGAGIVTSITVTDPGFGYDSNTPVVVLVSPPTTYYERFDNIKIAGDYGNIVGITTSAAGVSTTSPMIIFQFDSDSVLNQANYGNITKSGIATGDYFIVNNSIVGSGVTTLDGSEGFGVLGIGTTFIDNVYRADNVVSSLSGIVTVYSNVQSITGIGTTAGFTCAKYSWGKIYDYNSRTSPVVFTLNNNGLIGVSTAPLAFRTVPLKVNY